MEHYLKINTQKITNDGNKIEDKIHQVSVLINELEEAINQLANCWEGPAWAVFQENMARIIDEIRQVYDYVLRYAGCYLVASQDYTRAEQDILNEIE